ncbi:MAG: ATP-binding protein [Armatimonadetes bacterium]|nr:ATP-binding protein [Armatimonadota bacterium]
MSDIESRIHRGELDGTPKKRLFLSIISDYDLVTGLCELIDNAIDNRAIEGSEAPLKIRLELDSDRQVITVCDNAGGVGEGDLENLVAPGATNNDPLYETIGVFGVGSKRAVVALARHSIIKTHKRRDSSYEITVNDDWLTTEDWRLPYDQIPAIPAGTTSIQMSQLRTTITENDIEALKVTLGEIYQRFLQDEDVEIWVNEDELKPTTFENWSYPPDNPPRIATATIVVPDVGKVQISIECGLINDRDPVGDNYGVSFFCNDRLIAKHIKTRDVGYSVSAEAGVPHPDASLCRAIVSISGPARLMPWNSTKSQINFNDTIFLRIRGTIIDLVSHYTKLSRRLKRDWPGQVFQYAKGELLVIPNVDLSDGKSLALPPLPRVHKRKIDVIKEKNAAKLDNHPWLIGIVESLAAVQILRRQRFRTRNRLALILLDSTLEIAFKEFIVHNPSLFTKKDYSDETLVKLFKNRSAVILHVTKKFTKIPKKHINITNYYYGIRCKLIHERVSVDITDLEVDAYEKSVERILELLFKLKL